MRRRQCGRASPTNKATVGAFLGREQTLAQVLLKRVAARLRLALMPLVRSRDDFVWVLGIRDRKELNKIHR